MTHYTLMTNPNQWNHFVCAHAWGHLLQTWEWGALKEKYGWRPVRLALLDGEQIVAGAQILFRRLPWGVGAMGYLPKGPLLAPESPLWPEWLAALRQVARAERAFFVRLEPEWKAGEAPSIAAPHPQPSAIIQAPATIQVDLRPSPDAILAQMKPKWRYNIRLAERKGMMVRIGDESDLGTFYRLSEITSQRDGFPIRTEEYYRTAYRLFNQTNSVALFMAEFEGRAIASIMDFVCGRMALYLYGASSDEERHRMPNHLLQWRAMLWAKERGCEVYDLWGVPDKGELQIPNPAQASQIPKWSCDVEERKSQIANRKSQFATRHSPLPEGLLRFKEGFGGQYIRYAGAFDIVYQPIMYRVIDWLIAVRRSMRRVRTADQMSS